MFQSGLAVKKKKNTFTRLSNRVIFSFYGWYIKQAAEIQNVFPGSSHVARISCLVHPLGQPTQQLICCFVGAVFFPPKPRIPDY